MDSKEGKRRVICPIEKDGKTHWVRMGICYPNRDGSHNIYLDCLPINGRLQIREWDEPRKGRDREQEKDESLTNLSAHNESLPF